MIQNLYTDILLYNNVRHNKRLMMYTYQIGQYKHKQVSIKDLSITSMSIENCRMGAFSLNNVM